MDDFSSSYPEEPEEGFSAKAKAIAITPKVTGGISILCSLFLIHHILSDRRRRSLTYQRLVMVLCLCDIVSSFGIFLSTWPLPQGNNFGALYEDDNTGQNGLCTSQGVFIHWGVTTALANVVLSLHYLLVVKFRIPEKTMKRIEPYYLAFILLFGLVCIAIPLGLQIYGYNPYSRNIWCFIFVPPEDCADEAECIQRTVILRWALYFAPLLCCILICMVLMVVLYCYVQKIEATAVRWRSSSYTMGGMASPTQWPAERQRRRARQPQDFKQTKRVAVQASLYSLVFVIVWLPLLVLNTFNLVRHTWFDPESAKGFTVLWFVMFLQPLQGVFNLVIYRRFGVVKKLSNGAKRISKLLSNNRLVNSMRSDSSRNGFHHDGSASSKYSSSRRMGRGKSGTYATASVKKKSVLCLEDDARLRSAGMTREAQVLECSDRNFLVSSIGTDNDEVEDDGKDSEGRVSATKSTSNLSFDDMVLSEVEPDEHQEEQIPQHEQEHSNDEESVSRPCSNQVAEIERFVRFASKEFVQDDGNDKDAEEGDSVTDSVTTPDVDVSGRTSETDASGRTINEEKEEDDVVVCLADIYG